MRKDMPQVLIERPRSNSRAGYRAQRRSNARRMGEDAGAREAMNRRPKARDKYQTDLFGPLRRFLRRHVGRLWDKVHSEVCAHARLGNVSQHHLRRHLFDFVELHVELVDGVPHSQLRYFGRRALRPGTFYVCPKSGLLREVRRRKSRRQGQRQRFIVTDWRQYHRVNGVWCVVVLRPVPADAAGCFDALLGRRVVEMERSVRLKLYGRDAYALSCRPVNAEEGRDLKQRQL
jgi:hypothetical protein